jgi:hypothetical protein
VNELDGKINIAELAQGALVELAEDEIKKIIENIYDPNTDAKKARKLTLTLTFKPQKDRDMVNTEIQAKSSLAPYTPIETTICVGKDAKGKVIAEEYRKGQIAGQVEVNTDTGEIKNTKIVNMRG